MSEDPIRGIYDDPKKREQIDRESPQALERALNYFFAETVERLERLHATFENEEDAQLSTELQLADRGNALEYIKVEMAAGDYTLAIGILDLATETTTARSLAQSESDDPGAKAQIREQEQYNREFAVQRDRLIAVDEQLSRQYEKADFESWVRELLKRQEKVLGSKEWQEVEPKVAPRVSRTAAVLEKILADQPLNEKDQHELILEIIEETIWNYVGIEVELRRALLLRSYNKDRMLKSIEGNIRMRQFREHIERGEWIKVKKQ